MASDREGKSVSVETFQGMIMERKMEKRRKAEQRRQQDLQRIADMKSTEGIHPLERFPKEIWNMMLRQLDCCDDLGNMRIVHDLFKDLTDDTSIRDILFPKVLMVPHFKQLAEKTQFGEFGNELPLINYPLLRGVSKNTRRAIDKLHEDNLVDRMHETETGTVYDDCFSSSSKSFDALRLLVSPLDNDENKLDKILSDFRGKNPAKRFFTKSLVIQLRGLDACCMPVNGELFKRRRETLNRLREKITTLLGIIGTQIWHFTFQVDAIHAHAATASSLYNLFHDWTSQMPNLKWLEYISPLWWAHGEHPTRREKMTSAIRNLPFPHLKSLENITLMVDPTHYDGFLFWKSVLLSNQHVTNVSFDVMGWTECLLLPPEYSNGSELVKSLDLVGLCLSPRGGIEEIMNLNWKLKVINLNLKESSTSIKSLFELLGRFPTLENVKLVNVKIPENGDFDFLRLPNLIKFSLSALFRPGEEWVVDNTSSLHFLLSLQFLLNCKNLRKIKWILWSDRFKELREYMLRHECRDRRINFRAGLRVLYHSNIWDIFQNLDSVYVGFRRDGGYITYQNGSCSRNGGEANCSHEYRRGILKAESSFFASHKCEDRFGLCPLKLGYYDFENEIF